MVAGLLGLPDPEDQTGLAGDEMDDGYLEGLASRRRRSTRTEAALRIVGKLGQTFPQIGGASSSWSLPN
jgi:hypothetical protein